MKNKLIDSIEDALGVLGCLLFMMCVILHYYLISQELYIKIICIIICIIIIYYIIRVLHTIVLIRKEK